jgi:glycosyltransferase involved in cell wall biosynthesis
VLPVHNGEPYLPATLDSLERQTYRHFELLALENASSDNTLAILQKMQGFPIRIESSPHLLTIEENWARIICTPIATEFIVLLCADDLLQPNFLATINDLIKAHPDATLYHTLGLLINQKGVITRYTRPVPTQEQATDYLGQLHSFREDAFGSGYAMRYQDFCKVGGYPTFKRLLFADFYCYYALTALGYKVCASEYLVAFRQHPKGMTSRSSLNDFEEAAQQYRAALLTHALPHPQVVLLEQFLETFLLVCYRSYLFALIKQPNPRDMEQFEAFRDRFYTPNPAAKAYRYDFPLRWYIALAQQSSRWWRQVLYSILLLLIILRKQYHQKVTGNSEYISE